MKLEIKFYSHLKFKIKEKAHTVTGHEGQMGSENISLFFR
jgi:hypothetical protein